MAGALDGSDDSNNYFQEAGSQDFESGEEVEVSEGEYDEEGIDSDDESAYGSEEEIIEEDGDDI